MLLFVCSEAACETGDQLYRDPFPNGECFLIQIFTFLGLFKKSFLFDHKAAAATCPIGDFVSKCGASSRFKIMFNFFKVGQVHKGAMP